MYSGSHGGGGFGGGGSSSRHGVYYGQGGLQFEFANPVKRPLIFHRQMRGYNVRSYTGRGKPWGGSGGFPRKMSHFGPRAFGC